MFSLPSHFEPYTDKYFLRSLEILQKEALNPFVRAQLFIRNGPGKIAGIEESLAIIKKYTRFKDNGGAVFSLKEKESYSSGETVMVIEGRAQDIIPLETIVLGVLTEGTTRINDTFFVDTKGITQNVKIIAEHIGDRPLLYFGARHFRYDTDKKISLAAFEGGVSDASTDIGAGVKNKTGVGTIPHSLECIYAWKYGYENAVVETIKAFDRCIDTSVPRIALVDFANKEIDDSIRCAKALNKRLFGIRIDTCGENVMQGGIGYGVTISGVYAVRKALNKEGFSDVKIVLSSGFGDIKKVKAFVDAEKELEIQLFDTLGIGEVLPVRSVTMDIVGVGETVDSFKPIAKAGRQYNSNSRLHKVL